MDIHAEREAMVRGKNAGLQALIQGLLVTYVATGVVIEGRFGISGFVYPKLSATSGLQSSGMPFVGEWVIAGIVLLSLCDAAQGNASRRERGGLSLRSPTTLLSLSVWWGLVMLVLTILLGVPQGASAAGSGRMLLEGILLFYCVVRLDWGGEPLQRILRTFMLVSALHAFVIILAALAPEILPFETNVILGNAPRFAGLFMQPSRAALVMGFGAIVAIGCGLAKTVPWWQAALVVGLTAGGVLLSQTRGVMLAVVVGVLFIVFRYFRHNMMPTRMTVVVLVTGVLVSAALVALGFIDMFLGRFDDVGVTGVGTSRTDVYLFALRVIYENPGGIGLAGIEPASGDLGIPHAHNMYLQWGVNFGLFGLFLFFSFLVAMWRSVSVFARSSRSLDRRVRIGLAGVIGYFLVALLFEPYLQTNVGGWFWICAGLVSSAAGEGGRSSRAEYRT